MILGDELDDYMMSTLVLDSEELSLLGACVALVLGGVFQNEVLAISVSI